MGSRSGTTDAEVKKRNRSNLQSPARIAHACPPSEQEAWFRSEVSLIPGRAERNIVEQVYENLEEFIEWPSRPILLWEGCHREKKYHQYPATIKIMALNVNVVLDGRVNGPAVAAYRIAGGKRPQRQGSNNGWSVHHLYSGKFPSAGRQNTLHASWDGLHCTQSAGLVAVHPIADQMCDEYPCFSWLLRSKAFQRFGYDPDGVFSVAVHDRYGFVGSGCFVVPAVPTAAKVGSEQDRPDRAPVDDDARGPKSS